MRGEYSGPNFRSWWIIDVFFQGPMQGRFSLLFDASAVIILEQYTERSKLDSAAEFYFRRLLALFLFRLFNAHILLRPGDNPAALCAKNQSVISGINEYFYEGAGGHKRIFAARCKMT